VTLTVPSAELGPPKISSIPNKSSKFSISNPNIRNQTGLLYIDCATETVWKAYIGKLLITGKLFDHSLNAVIFAIGLSSSFKDRTEDILWRFMLFNALTS